MGRWTIVNGLLGLIVMLLGYEIVRTWARGLPPVTASAPAAVPAPAPHEKGKRGGDKAGGRGAQQAPAAMVALISDKDLFDVSRRAPAPDEVKTEAQAPVTKPPDGVTVVGVRIFGKDREVFVNDATQNPAVGRRLRGETPRAHKFGQAHAGGRLVLDDEDAVAGAGRCHLIDTSLSFLHGPAEQ